MWQVIEMDEQKLMLLVHRDENTKLDFKLKLSIETESGKKELAKDISAIANSRGGRGYILFGIEDKTKSLIGIQEKDFLEESIQQIVATRIDPPVPVLVETVPIDGVIIGVITIYSTDQKPHQIRETGAFPIRRGSTTDIMRKDEIASLLEETGIISHELIPVLKAGSDDLNMEKIMDFFKKSGLSGMISSSLLLQTGILVQEKDFSMPHPSFGGMILFGKTPNLFLPHCRIHIHNGLSSEHPSHYVTAGTLLEQLDSCSSFLLKCIGSGNDRLVQVILEHLGNAVLHRDYFDIHNFIEVFVNEKNIEIINPGFSRMGTESKTDNNSKRNMWLYVKAITIDSSHAYFHKEYDTPLTYRERRRIKYFNLVAQNKFKVVIPMGLLPR